MPDYETYRHYVYMLGADEIFENHVEPLAESLEHWKDNSDKAKLGTLKADDCGFEYCALCKVQEHGENGGVICSKCPLHIAGEGCTTRGSAWDRLMEKVGDEYYPPVHEAAELCAILDTLYWIAATEYIRVAPVKDMIQKAFAWHMSPEKDIYWGSIYQNAPKDANGVKLLADYLFTMSSGKALGWFISNTLDSNKGAGFNWKSLLAQKLKRYRDFYQEEPKAV